MVRNVDSCPCRPPTTCPPAFNVVLTNEPVLVWSQLEVQADFEAFVSHPGTLWFVWIAYCAGDFAVHPRGGVGYLVRELGAGHVRLRGELLQLRPGACTAHKTTKPWFVDCEFSVLRVGVVGIMHDAKPTTTGGQVGIASGGYLRLSHGMGCCCLVL